MAFPSSPTNGQTTTINGVKWTYKSADDAWYKTATGITSATVTASTISISGNSALNAISANGSLGTAGQVLTSNGSDSYWASVSSAAAGSNTQIYFNDSGVANATSGHTFNKSTNSMYVANSIGVNVSTPLAKLDISGTSVQNSLVTTGAMDLSLGQMFTITVGGATTFSFTNVPATRAMTVVLEITNGGSAVMTWPASIKWPGGIAPSLTSSGTDVLVFVTQNGGTTWRGNIYGRDVK